MIPGTVANFTGSQLNSLTHPIPAAEVETIFTTGKADYIAAYAERMAPGRSTTASAYSGYWAGSTITGRASATADGKTAGALDVRLHKMASSSTCAAGCGAGHNAGAASTTLSSGADSGSALAALMLMDNALPSTTAPAVAVPDQASATPSATSAGPAAHRSASSSPAAGAADKYRLAAAAGRASDTSSRVTPLVAGASGGPAAAASEEPSAAGASAATAGRSGGSSAASSCPQWMHGGE